MSVHVVPQRDEVRDKDTRSEQARGRREERGELPVFGGQP